MTATIYHNPRCGTSRKVLGMLTDAGIAPKIVEYLKTPPDRDQLTVLLRAMDMSPRALLRRKEPVYAELELDDPAKTDDQLIDAIVAHPILMERPIVVTAKGTVLCRPAEKVLGVIA